MLDQLSGEWVAFQQCLIDSDAMLKKSKEKFKTGLINSSEEFKKTVTTLFDDFQNKGPFSSTISVKEVCRLIFCCPQLLYNEILIKCNERRCDNLVPP